MLGKRVEYRVVHSRDVIGVLQGIDHIDPDTASIVRYENNLPVEWISNDGGEPEDQSLWRDWDWVANALKAAYLLGKRHSVEEHKLEAKFGPS